MASRGREISGTKLLKLKEQIAQGKKTEEQLKAVKKYIEKSLKEQGLTVGKAEERLQELGTKIERLTQQIEKETIKIRKEFQI